MASIENLVEPVASWAAYTTMPNWNLETCPGVQHLRRRFGSLSMNLVIDLEHTQFSPLRESVGVEASTLDAVMAEVTRLDSPRSIIGGSMRTVSTP